MNIEYYNNEKTVDEYLKMAEGINGNKLINKLNSFLPNGSTVLELGSGPGSDWEILSKSFITTGSDNSPIFLKHLLNKYPAGRFLSLDASDLETSETFDCIYSNKVLHHLTEEELSRSVKEQRKRLNSKGIICHSFWMGEGSEFFKEMFVQYHNEEMLHNSFGKYFEIIVLEKYKEFDDNDSILLIARKKV